MQDPLIAPAEPPHTCATGAVGHAFHAGDPRFVEIDRGLDDLLHKVAVEPDEIGRLYGMMRYGNRVCSHSQPPALAYVHYKDTESEKALRFVGPYNNESNDQILGVWGNFIRTGRADHFHIARNYSRAVADVCVIHAHPSCPDAVGLMHYHAGHQWSGGPSPSHTLAAGVLLDYYFTGNRRLLDVAREMADWAVRTQEPCGIVSNRGSALHREFTGPLWVLLEVYQATWDERYGDLARRSLNWFLRTLPQPGDYPVSVYTAGVRGNEAVVEPPGGRTTHARDVYSLFEIALRLFPSDTLRRHVLAEADEYLWNELTDNFVTAEQAEKHLPSASTLWQIDDRFFWTNWATHPGFLSSIACLAYDMTGNPVYAAYAKDHLFGTFLRQVDRCRHFADFRFTWLWFGSYIPRLIRTVAEAWDKDPAGLAEAEKAWREKRAAKGNEVYTGPGIDWTRDQMNTTGNITNRPPVDLPRNGQNRLRTPLTNLGPLSTDPLP